MERSGTGQILWGMAASLLSAVSWVLSMPPFEFAEAAYIMFVPLLLWLFSRPDARLVGLLGLGTGLLTWCSLLIWLRHVTWFGTITLSAVLALFFVLWLLAAARVFRALPGANFPRRVFLFSGLAGLWVVLEWTRSWLFWGFPWAPLALSQWERPVVLQITAWTGAYGLSFLLVFFNCCVAQTLHSRVVQRQRKLWSGWFSPDLYLAMGLLGLCLYVFFHTLPKREASVPVFTAAVVQPYIAPELKWENERELENLAILERQTRFVGSLESDLILWPEAATPWPIIGYPEMQARIARLSNELGRPILMGNLAHDREAEIWQNGIYLMEPGSGLSAETYAKRELVPFGEYVPAPFGFIEKVVPVGGSFSPGQDTGLIQLTIGDRSWRIGPLVCYEDVFPALARASTRAGAQVLFVATNNAWYGEEGGAEQHAAHAVLRAVENRRPVVRCGNGGWSGWIDPYGTVREVLRNEEDSIYFRGGGTFRVVHYEPWTREKSFYTRYGDWFVALSGCLVVPAAFYARRRFQGVNFPSENAGR